MTPKAKQLFIAVLVVQVVFLLGIVGYRESILAFGRTAVLQTVPVDPRDLFKGEYVTLRYEISTLGNERITPRIPDEPPDEPIDRTPPRTLPGTSPGTPNESDGRASKTYVLRGEINEGDTVYVALTNVEEDEQTLDVQTGEPTTKTDLFIKGRVVSSTEGMITVEYGIEQYFVPEGRGTEIEQADDIKVRVKIDRSGTAAIEALIVDGMDWEP